jgi:hypothetical protein
MAFVLLIGTLVLVFGNSVQLLTMQRSQVRASSRLAARSALGIAPPPQGIAQTMAVSL